MDRDKRILILLIAAGLLIPAALTGLMILDGGDAIDITFQSILLFTLFPIIALSAYMWLTGKGAMFIAGYNTSPRHVREQYDTERLAKFVGKLVFFSVILMLLAMESIFLLTEAWPFWVLLSAGMAIIIGGIVYMNTGGRFLKEGATDPKLLRTEEDKKRERQTLYALLVLGAIITAVIVIVLVLVAPAGGVDASLQDDGLKVDAPMVNKLIPYDQIDSVELRDDLDIGRRVGGFGGTNIRSGNFNNDEFGRYVLASYNDVPLHIVVRHSGGILAFNLSTVEDTQAMFEDLKARL
ncbi:MAG TPA: DUF3784 domain-containing protein [Methanomassiliicoccaceae archaeon]|jgi:hypothetical protein|nr:DUF3784 domain-containing protein [Euryarchaeota archaeon]HOB39104.1 DUF3784 domain-containing protein [Methanomassiliicoccaceae archaeon]HOQ25620.1 DUF3784 domain-containing protein [Methanomassiliicoccaceae archaeon]HPT73587.1 DUF3784 domain-containing protein [Methanomassiliicoccaceae archaeon]HQA22075.1 DUF3784 domain-containing protein [Methanomassiliicoccaceae archaeon]